MPEHFEEIIDEGYSGFDSKAPGLERIIQLIEQDKVSILIVAELSCFTRDYRKAKMYMEEAFPKHNVHFVVVNSNEDTPEIQLKELTRNKDRC